jgi:hypothetical protein
MIVSKNSQEELYRGCSIKTVKSRSGWRALAYRGKVKASSILEASTKDDAVIKVRNELDRIADQKLIERGAGGYPTLAEVREVWRYLEPNSGQIAMLRAHYSAQDHTLTATQLSRAAGYAGYESANLHYGKLGRELAEMLEWQPHGNKADDSAWTYALATDADEAAREEGQEIAWEWRWKMRPEIVAMLRERGFD